MCADSTNLVPSGTMFGVFLFSDRSSFEMSIFKMLTQEAEIKNRTEPPLESRLPFPENPLI